MPVAPTGKRASEDSVFTRDGRTCNGTSGMEVVYLCVGGITYNVSRETLTKYPGSLLADWFDTTDQLHHLPRDNNGAYFIDRDGHVFRHILNYLRSGSLILPKDYQELELLQREAQHYRLATLLQVLSLHRRRQHYVHDVSLEIGEVVKQWPGGEGYTITLTVSGRTADVEEMREFVRNESRMFDYCPASQWYDDEKARNYSRYQINLSHLETGGAGSSLGLTRKQKTSSSQDLKDLMRTTHPLQMPLNTLVAGSKAKSASMCDIFTPTLSGDTLPAKLLLRQKLGEYLLMSGWRMVSAVAVTRGSEEGAGCEYREKWLHETVHDFTLVRQRGDATRGSNGEVGSSRSSDEGEIKQVQPPPISQAISWSKLKKKMKDKMNKNRVFIKPKRFASDSDSVT